jgi:hypothetical protein
MLRLFLAGLFFSYLSADGLSDLKNALGRYEAKSTVRGTLEVQTWSRQGRDAGATETRGRATATVEYGQQGLRMQWRQPFLQQIDRETRARSSSNPPTNQALNATWAMGMRDTYNLMNPVEVLLRMLENATLISEGRESYNGTQVRVLNFSVPMTSEFNRLRRWLRDFTSTVKIWIDSDGTPLGFSQKAQIKARAFIVISMEQTREESLTYANVGDHLICVRHEESQEFQGGGEHGSSRTVRSLRVN